MARAPRASVSMSSGQGVSRLSYQRGHAMRGGGGEAPKVSSKFEKGDTPRQYGKGKSSESSKGPGINIDYEHTIPIRNLDSIENAYKGKPTKPGVKLKHEKAKKLK